jgi:hypothetical protein
MWRIEWGGEKVAIGTLVWGLFPLSTAINGDGIDDSCRVMRSAQNLYIYFACSLHDMLVDYIGKMKD